MIYFRVFNSPLFGGKGSTGLSSASVDIADDFEREQVIKTIAEMTEVTPSDILEITEEDFNRYGDE